MKDGRVFLIAGGAISLFIAFLLGIYWYEIGAIISAMSSPAIEIIGEEIPEASSEFGD